MNKYKKILFIDDELDSMTECIEALELLGYDVITAENGRKGLVLFKMYNFPVVITDIMMPEMNGLDFLKEINEINPMANSIIISSYGNKINIKAALRLHAYNFIEKQSSNLVDEIVKGVEDAMASFMKNYGFKDYSKKFKKMIVDNQHREVVDELMNLSIIDSVIENTLLINMAFLNNLENQKRNLLIQSLEYNQEMSKINNNLLQVIDQLTDRCEKLINLKE